VYVKRQTQNPTSEIRMSPNYACRKIFTQEQENTLGDYILNCSKMCYGQTIKNIKQIAYEMARLNNIPVPKNWKQKKEAGHEWFLGFMARNPNLSICQPEACSLTRITSFNRHNVDIFFNNLENIYKRYDALADGTRIYNLDETSTTTVEYQNKLSLNFLIWQMLPSPRKKYGNSCVLSFRGVE
jgi:hypothetical protein